MANNHAIAIGINKYDFLPSLSYAQNDAVLMTRVFQHQLGFENIFTLTDGNTKDKVIDKEENFIVPTRANILDICINLSSQVYWQPGDNIWLFFTGRGIKYRGSDYLMPIDGKSADIENTAISFTTIIQHLQEHNPANIILFLDIHADSSASNYVNTYNNLQKNNENITIFFAGDRYGSSYDLPTLKHGIFAYVLAEALGNHGQCASLAKLAKYLHYRVPSLAKQYYKQEQNPIAIASVHNRSVCDRILLPQYATKHDIETLKSLALNAEAQGEYEQAKNICSHLLEIDGNDWEALSILRKIDNLFTKQFSLSPKSEDSFYQLTNILVRDERKISTTEYSEITVIGAMSKDNTNGHFAFDEYLDQNLEENINGKEKHYQNSNVIEIETDIENFAIYQKLRDFLKTENWRKADQETARLLLEISQSKRDGWLSVAAINHLNPQALAAIDRIWCQYSKNRFGFSIQKQIWESMGGSPDADYQLWCEYCDRIGWRINQDWCFYSDLAFDLTAPIGQFPAAGIVNVITPWQGWSVGVFGCFTGCSNLMYLIR